MSALGPGDRRRLLALAHLEGFGPARLRSSLRVGVERAWGYVVTGREPDGGASAGGSARGWPAQLHRMDPDELWDRHVAAGVQITVLGDPGHPELALDPLDHPAMLFWRGPHAPRADVTRRRPPSVALVGTRRATRYGVEVARDLGHRLAQAGVEVVSGLALGVDAAAHAGAVGVPGGTPPLAVVAGGLDVVYPARNRELWRAVEHQGAVVSEVPLGQRPERWRFPARNRIVVGLSDIVVVVESHLRGGSLITASLAADAGVPVMAVPGPVTSDASAGTNALLVDGCAPCRTVDDVLLALGVDPAPSAGATVGATDATSGAPGAHRSPLHRALVDALEVGGSSVGELVEAVGAPLGAVGLALVELEEDRLVVAEHGRYARTARPAPP